MLAWKFEELGCLGCGWSGGGRRRSTLRHGNRNQSGRHVIRIWNCAADGRAHRCKACSTEKSTPTWPRLSSENASIGSFGIVAVKLLDSTFLVPGHSRLPQHGVSQDNCSVLRPSHRTNISFEASARSRKGRGYLATSANARTASGFLSFPIVAMG